jgi:uncharacterized protein YndB with AHSA1/START domain
MRADGALRAVRFERTFDATPEELWAALTEPGQLRGWLAEARRFEPFEGGAVELRFGDGEDERAYGTVRVFDPPRVLEYSWDWPGEDGSIVRYELVPQGEATLLVLDHRGLPSGAAVGYAGGWHAHLDCLAAHLCGDRVSWDARFEQLAPVYRERAEATA